MFSWIILSAIYSYAIFGLGLLGWLYPLPIIFLTIVYGLTTLLIIKNFTRSKLKTDLTDKIILVLLFVQIVINFIGALGPELGFDALWYHLTIPKIWLQAHHIFFLSDGRYYYSVQPKLVEMYYLVALRLGNEIGAKLIHFGFGILIMVVIYKLARNWLNQKYALLACLIFYANLVVGWQSITAYIDLGRTFFEVLAFYYLIKNQVNKSALILGLAIATKFIAIGSLPIFLVLIYLQTHSLKKLVKFLELSLLPVLPWWIFAFVSTGNPIYPIFSGYDLSSSRLLSDFITIFIRSADPLSPVYLMLVPVGVWLHKKLPQILIIYSALSLIIWWLIPRTGGGRFILPYLPVYSVLAAVTVFQIKDKFLQTTMITIIVMLAIVSIGYRGLANAKFLPVILGRENKLNFVKRQLGSNYKVAYYYWPNPLAK